LFQNLTSRQIKNNFEPIKDLGYYFLMIYVMKDGHLIFQHQFFPVYLFFNIFASLFRLNLN